MNKPEIIEKLNELGVEFDEKANKDELKKLLEQQDNTEHEPKEETQSSEPTAQEELANLESKQYVVIHDFKDLQDNDTIYIKDDIYPKTETKISDDRIKELMSSENKIGKPLIQEQD
ncbi:hypothetical protein ACFSTA_12520 [Ornithinibacillus salinisoli]|uniref:HeH/LEM domain-containing protein n=1 Tax=Ornithinibacillus salinisoli TaxID=1848459 RepID=A0ABW4W393_9BACI